MAAEGRISIKSSFGPEETMNRFEAEVRAKRMTVFAHIDHAAGAAAVGMPLRPTGLLIFGNAKADTPLMQAAQTIGIDRPLKTLERRGFRTTIPPCLTIKMPCHGARFCFCCTARDHNISAEASSGSR